MADFPLFVPVDAPWRPGLVVVRAQPASDSGLPAVQCLPPFRVVTQGAQKGVLLSSLPGLAPSTKYTLSITVLPE